MLARMVSVAQIRPIAVFNEVKAATLKYCLFAARDWFDLAEGSRLMANCQQWQLLELAICRKTTFVCLLGSVANCIGCVYDLKSFDV